MSGQVDVVSILAGLLGGGINAYNNRDATALQKQKEQYDKEKLASDMKNLQEANRPAERNLIDRNYESQLGFNNIKQPVVNTNTLPGTPNVMDNNMITPVQTMNTPVSGSINPFIGGMGVNAIDDSGAGNIQPQLPNSDVVNNQQIRPDVPLTETPVSTTTKFDDLGNSYRADVSRIDASKLTHAQYDARVREIAGIYKNAIDNLPWQEVPSAVEHVRTILGSPNNDNVELYKDIKTKTVKELETWVKQNAEHIINPSLDAYSKARLDHKIKTTVQDFDEKTGQIVNKEIETTVGNEKNIQENYNKMFAQKIDMSNKQIFEEWKIKTQNADDNAKITIPGLTVYRQDPTNGKITVNVEDVPTTKGMMNITAQNIGQSNMRLQSQLNNEADNATKLMIAELKKEIEDLKAGIKQQGLDSKPGNAGSFLPTNASDILNTNNKDKTSTGVSSDILPIAKTANVSLEPSTDNVSLEPITNDAESYANSLFTKTGITPSNSFFGAIKDTAVAPNKPVIAPDKPTPVAPVDNTISPVTPDIGEKRTKSIAMGHGGEYVRSKDGKVRFELSNEAIAKMSDKELIRFKNYMYAQNKNVQVEIPLTSFDKGMAELEAVASGDTGSMELIKGFEKVPGGLFKDFTDIMSSVNKKGIAPSIDPAIFEYLYNSQDYDGMKQIAGLIERQIRTASSKPVDYKVLPILNSSYNTVYKIVPSEDGKYKNEDDDKLYNKWLSEKKEPRIDGKTGKIIMFPSQAEMDTNAKKALEFRIMKAEILQKESSGINSLASANETNIKTRYIPVEQKREDRKVNILQQQANTDAASQKDTQSYRAWQMKNGDKTVKPFTPTDLSSETIAKVQLGDLRSKLVSKGLDSPKTTGYVTRISRITMALAMLHDGFTAETLKKSGYPNIDRSDWIDAIDTAAKLKIANINSREDVKTKQDYVDSLYNNVGNYLKGVK